MKKLFAILLAALMVAALFAGCGSKSGTVTTDGTDLDILESPFRKMFSVRVFWLVLLTLFGVVTS